MGYGSPVGNIIGLDKPLEDYSLFELDNKGITAGKVCELFFQSGIKVSGLLKYIRKNKYGKILLITFENCHVTYKNQILFQPEWGTYDMAVGEKVISVFAGSADKNEYDSDLYISPTNTIRTSINPKPLLDLYQEVRNIRNTGLNRKRLEAIFYEVSTRYEKAWLLPLEILEICEDDNLKKLIHRFLSTFVKNNPEFKKLIVEGLKLIENEYNSDRSK